MGSVELERRGVSRFSGVGPGWGVGGDGGECLSAEGEEGALLVAALRGGHSETEALLALLARAHCAGVRVQWPVLFAGRGAEAVDLPTYAFQRERFWIAPAADASDLRSVGLRVVEHPLLGAAVRLAGERDEWLFTGRVSTEHQPWAGDHVALGVAVVPGTRVVELALAAGLEVGCETVEELTLEAPLVLQGRDAFELQLLVEAPDELGQRAFAIHARLQRGVRGRGRFRAGRVDLPCERRAGGGLHRTRA